MKHKLQQTFNLIHAEEELKEQTKLFLANKTQGYSKCKQTRFKPLIPIAICVLAVLMIVGGFQIYFTPVSVISVDVNPSVELAVNCFDTVVSVEEYNEDGQKLKDALNLQFLNYIDAVEKIIKDQTIQDYLLQDEVLSIVVTGSDAQKDEEMLAAIRNCTAGQKNTYCYRADADQVEAAHAEGLSYGKYRAFLEVQAFDPDITPEEIQKMSMREIRELLAHLSNETANEVIDDGHSENKGAGDNGAGHRWQKGQSAD